MEGLFTGKSFKESFKSIDWADVLTASLDAGLSAMTLGISKLFTSSTHALLNAEFDYKLFDKDGKKIANGAGRFKYGFGKGFHEKEQGEVLKDVILGGVGVLVDQTFSLSDKVKDLLDDKSLKGVKKTFKSLLFQTFKGKDYEFPLADNIAEGLVAPHESYVDAKQDEVYDKIKEKVKKKAEELKIKHENNKWKRNYKKGNIIIGNPTSHANAA